MIDSHCHLTDSVFAHDIDEVIERARRANVSPMVTIADSLEESRNAVVLAKKYSDLYCTVGVHPHNASTWKEGDYAILKVLAGSGKVLGIGEIGLDYHYMNSPKEDQIVAFREQLTLARELGLAAVIHTREAIEDTWEVIQAINHKQIVVHCCSESWEDIERFVNFGSYLSFTGIATFPKSTVIRETIKRCPIERIMIETDAPYLSPQPYRGKRNEPSYVIEVACVVAEVKNLSLKMVDDVTTKNAKSFFGIE